MEKSVTFLYFLNLSSEVGKILSELSPEKITKDHIFTGYNEV